MAKQWYLAGEADSFDSLEALIADHELQKGDRVRVEMKLKTPVAQAFDIVPNSWCPAPAGMSVVDIWGTGWPVPWSENWGYVELEADPAWLVAVFAFMKAHWVALVIAGVALWWLLAKIKVWIFTELGITPPPDGNGDGNGDENGAIIDIGSIMSLMVTMMIVVMMMKMMTGVMPK